MTRAKHHMFGAQPMVCPTSAICRLNVWQAGAGFGRALLLAAVATGAAAASVAAQDLPAAPQYYLDFVIGASLAEQYNANCPTVEIDPETYTIALKDVQAKLQADGFPTVKPHEHMLLPPASETDGTIFAMLDRNQAAADPEAAFCAEAAQEMEKGSVAGSFLMGVPQ